MKERKPYKYQYDHGTLIMNGWCGLNETEKEWLRQLEYFVDSQRDKFFDHIDESKTNDVILRKFMTYQSNIKCAKDQIKQLRSRMNMKYGV